MSGMEPDRQGSMTIHYSVLRQEAQPLLSGFFSSLLHVGAVFGVNVY
jgi:hypothetical protein